MFQNRFSYRAQLCYKSLFFIFIVSGSNFMIDKQSTMKLYLQSLWKLSVGLTLSVYSVYYFSHLCGFGLISTHYSSGYGCL